MAIEPCLAESQESRNSIFILLTLRPCHRNDFTFKVTFHDIPFALVYAEGGQTMISRVLISLGNDPSWGV